METKVWEQKSGWGFLRRGFLARLLNIKKVINFAVEVKQGSLRWQLKLSSKNSVRKLIIGLSW